LPTGQRWSTEDYEPEYLLYEDGDEEHNPEEEADEYQDEYQDEEVQAHHPEYEDGSPDEVENGEEVDEEERNHYEGEHEEDDDPGPEQGQWCLNPLRYRLTPVVADGEEEVALQTLTGSSPTMPGSLHARSPSLEPYISKVHPTCVRHVRFAPGIISPAVRPPRRMQAYSPETPVMTPLGRTDPPSSQKPSGLVDTPFGGSAELERIRQLEEEVKMLREEVSSSPSNKDGHPDKTPP
jgi:hypothetical protein